MDEGIQNMKRHQVLMLKRHHSPFKRMNLHAIVLHEYESGNEARNAKTKPVNRESFHTPPKSPLCTIDDPRAIQKEKRTRKKKLPLYMTCHNRKREILFKMKDL